MKTKVDRIAKELGPAYSVKIIDRERCVYRDLGNRVDFEVSGLGRKRNMDCYLFIWGPREDGESWGIIEQVPHIKSLEQLRTVLEEKANWYLKRYPRSRDERKRD